MRSNRRDVSEISARSVLPAHRAGVNSLQLLTLATVGFLAACGTDPGAMPMPTETPAEVGSYLADLPSWSAYTADVNEPTQPPQPVGPPEDVGADTVSVQQIEEDGSVTVLPDVVYQCTEQDYNMASNPEELVMYDPDVEILWPGGLVQGRSRKALGSFEGLPIAERAPLRVSIPSFAFAENFREVEGPNQATVGAAVGALIGDATARGIQAPSAIDFEMETYHSEESFALSANLSGRYLGFSASVGTDISRDAAETTVTAHYIQRMFTVVVEGGQSPGAFFSSDFTEQKLQEQIDQGRMGPENLPIYVSNVVYGRMMMFSFTSTASESEIRATLNAAYEAVVGGVELDLSAKQRKIFETAKIEVTTRGGDAQNVLDVIRSGDWSQYFTEDAPLSTAAPLSYTLRNLGDNSIAGRTESTDYSIRECQAIPASPGSFAFLDPQIEDAPFTGGVTTLTGDVNGDGRVDLIWNQLQQGTNQLYVGISAGDGTFDFTAPFVHPESPTEGWGNYSVHVANINGDGFADLVWNYLDDENKTFVGLGAGDGTFGTPSARIHSATGFQPYTLLVGDAMGPTGSGDGLDDLNFVRWNTGPLGVYGGMSEGDSQFDFRPFRSLSTGTWANYALRSANIDGDGDMDFFFAHRGATGLNRVYAVTSNGDDQWALQAFADHPNGTENWTNYTIRKGDVNGLGSEAIIWADTTSLQNHVTVGMWNGSGFNYSPVEAAEYRSNPQNPPLSVEVGDVDGDGDVDLIWGSRLAGANRTYVSLGEGDGTFDFATASQLHPDSDPNWSQFRMYVADVNGDGRDDIIWNHPAATNRIYTAIGKN